MKDDEGAATAGRSVFTDQRLRAARLVRDGALETARDAVAAHGHAEDAAAIYREARGRVEYLERCLAEAQAVLGGDLGASTRLWLLLRETVADAGGDLPPSVLEEAAARARAEPPRLLDGDSLLRLVAGTVRAANRPDEADRMLDSLGLLLRPLLLLDFAASAAADAPPGQDGALKTLIFARRAPQWRDELAASHADPNRPPAPDPPQPSPPGGNPPFKPDRDKFDHGSWLVHASDATKGVGISLWPCLGEARHGMSRIDIFGGRYQIDSLSNPGACPGQTLTIRGSGFGPQGRVAFPTPDLTDPAFQLGLVPGHPMVAGVEPVRWTDTEIDVVVPPWATSGELRLRVFQTHRDPCMDVDVHRLGNSVLFRGGLARVFKVFLDSVEVEPDARRPPCIDPLEVTRLTWQASSGPGVSVSAEITAGGRTLWSQNNLPGGFGAALIDKISPMPAEPTHATLALTARGPCGAAQPLSIPVILSVRPRLAIEYVEVTQGVQGDRGEVETGRGMPLVATKDTAVRVHLSCDRRGWFGNRLDKITGSLRVDNHPPLAPTNVRNLVPDKLFISVERLSRPDFTNETLNFLIPAAWLTPGQHTLSVRVVCDDPSGRIDIGQAVQPTWSFKLPMRVRCLYLGRRLLPRPDGPAATAAGRRLDARRRAARVRRPPDSRPPPAARRAPPDARLRRRRGALRGVGNVLGRGAGRRLPSLGGAIG